MAAAAGAQRDARGPPGAGSNSQARRALQVEGHQLWQPAAAGCGGTANWTAELEWWALTSPQSGVRMQTVTGLHHAAYRCRDAELTRQFYEDFLGLPLVDAFEIKMTVTKAK